MENQIYFGDNLKILKKLPSESIDLIYIDPPFNTKKTQKRTTIKTIRDTNGDRKGFKGNTYRTVEVGTKEYKDTFESSDDTFDYSLYIDGFLRPRLKEAYRLLKAHGSLYFHIDYREVHYCKILLDQIFGRDCFLNEIIWAYDYGGRAKSKWPAKHDNILFYVKDSKNYIFNTSEIDREPYMAPGLVGPEKAEKGKLPTDVWWRGFVDGKPQETSKLLSDPWWQSHTSIGKGSSDATWQTIVPTGSKERLGYPTQKPRKLIDRIIKASSLPGSIILDFFAGSGTVGESCLEFSRNFILIDNNQAALEVMARRFAGFKSVQWINFDPIPFQKGNKQLELEETKPNMPSISLEFLMLAATASYIQQDLEEYSDLWRDSPFEWILKLPARRKGKLGRNLLLPWLISKGISADPSGDSSETLLIKGYKVATKFSTIWTKGFYRFQQIRADGYDYVICLGISPFEAHCWIFDRNHAIKYATPQHYRGTKVADYWMEINPNQPKLWTKGCGGTLDQAFEILKNLRKK
jgi:site-specific DNA-methyltransferase (adenine-specific)